ncbi:MAG TPA: sensor histidine kinase [Longimicrobiaceae bacterium]
MKAVNDSPTNASAAMPWRLRRAEMIAIIVFWTFVALLTAANRLLDPRFPGQQQQQILTSIPVAIAFFESYLWALLTPIVFWITSRFSLERSPRVSRVGLLLGAGVVIAILVDVAGAYFRLNVIDVPFRRPGGVSPVLSVTRLWFVNDLITFMGVMAAGFARDFFLRYRLRQQDTVKLQAHAAHLQAQLAEARLEALRMQLNPHFLFNTLHAVSTLVERDPRGVRRMIARLSELLRYTLNGDSEQEIPLEKEMDFLRRYLEIMEIRFQGRLEVATQIDPEVQGALVPNLILQPLVENAVKHGVGNKVGVGRIEVRARREGDQLVLGVRDDGPGLAATATPPSSGGVGLRNVRARLEELYGENEGVVFLEADGGGLIAEIRLPFHTRGDLRAAGVPSPEEDAIHAG